MAVARARGQDATMAMLQKICERLDKLESVMEKRKRSGEPVVCWKCREEGHFARDNLKTKSLQ